MDLTDLAIQHLPNDRKTNPSGGYYINCVMCHKVGAHRPDTKHRGGFTKNPDGGFIYHCHNCKFATKWEYNGYVGKKLMWFLTTLGVKPTDVPIGLRLLRPTETLDTVVEIKAPEVAITFDELKLPQGAHSLEYWCEDDETPSTFFDAFEYIASRGEAVFEGSKYYWTADDYMNRNMDKRIIIPFYHHGVLVGWTGRKFGDVSGSKYYSKHQTDYMYNQDMLEDDKIDTIILVEGILDAIAINGVAVLGNKLSTKQVNLLNLHKKRIIVVPDRNKAGEYLVNQAFENNWDVSIPEWDRDVDDCSKSTSKYGMLYTMYSIYQAALPSKSNMQRTKIMNNFKLSRL